jgi:Ca2+:H+ antiporter
VTNNSLRSEWFLPISALTALAFLIFGDTLQNVHTGAVTLFATLAWLLASILLSALAVVRHAEGLQLQRSMNIFLGSVLSTIGLTIPIMLVVSHRTGKQIYLGVQTSSLVMLLLTLFMSAVTFARGRTNVLQGAVHALLFLAYVLLIFQN